MEVSLNNVSRKFNKEWVFRNISRKFDNNSVVAITGPNGSGKTTLLQLIAGSLLPTSGEIGYQIQERIIPVEHIYRHLSLVSPALGLPEDFILTEFLDFHFNFKKLRHGIDISELPVLFQLENAKKKFVKDFSTGMKQRLKLGIALYADTSLLLLDEPATNLDKAGFEWYLTEVGKVTGKKLIFICSNRPEEYSFCDTHIEIMDYK
jgi:ABC-type multidrug transport system ATPase subunit